MKIFFLLLSVVFYVQAFEIADSIPHKKNHFTQGLFFADGILYESTGLYGKSGLYRYDKNFKIQDSLKLEKQYFGEGSVAIADEIFLLTWKSNTAFKIDKQTFKIKKKYKIPTEGWGITFCNNQIYLSDGSSNLYTVSPENFNYENTFPIFYKNIPVQNLNELECVNNFLYANIWGSDSIAIIDLNSNQVIRFLDFSEKATAIREKDKNAEVLNGMAYDGKFLWITGKLWPYIYKVKIN